MKSLSELADTHEKWGSRDHFGLGHQKPMKTRSTERGQAAIMLLLSFTVLLGFVGLATDVGTLFYSKRLLRRVADSAAVGGATELKYGAATSAAQADATRNGVTDGVNGTITVNAPPVFGPHAGDTNFVEVIAAQDQPTYFMKMFNLNSVTVRARAVAGFIAGSGSGCFYALSPSAEDAIYLNGNLVNLQAPGCNIFVNSNDSRALYANGNSITINAKGIGITGNYVQSGNFFSASPTPVTGMVPVSDPLAYLAKPTVGACDFNNKTVNSNTTLSPGVYCGGLLINGSPTVTFSPGLYIFKGGNSADVYVDGNATLTGAGVTFYSTGSISNYFIFFNGNIQSTLSAPTTGTYEGILMFKDPQDPNGQQLYFNGTNTVLNYTGAIYAPKSFLYFNVSSGTSSGLPVLIANTMYFNGSFTMNNSFLTFPNGSPVKSAVLVE